MADRAPDGAPMPRRRSGYRRIALELIVLAGFYSTVTTWQERHLIRLHEAAPSFALDAIDGRQVSLASLRGKRVLVHFWATWCGVCRREFGSLNAVNRGLAGDEALISIVADSEDQEHVRRFVAEHEIQYPVLLGTNDVLRAFHVDTFPTNYFLDRNGAIAAHTIGMSTRMGLGSRLGCAK